MMRAASTILMLAVATPAAAQDALTITFEAGGEQTLQASRDPLSGKEPAYVRVDGTDSATALLDYAPLDDGDVAGLAWRADATRWVSIQVEKITPAHLVAVRLHDRAGAMPAGRLVATAPVPGHGAMRVRLSILREPDGLTLRYALPDGEWQVLTRGLDPAFLGPEARPVVFAFDGAGR